jgi:hypothetical protein
MKLMTFAALLSAGFLAACAGTPDRGYQFATLPTWQDLHPGEAPYTVTVESAPGGIQCQNETAYWHSGASPIVRRCYFTDH